MLETNKKVAKTNILLYNKKTTIKYIYRIKSLKYIKY